jgi:predicted dehydrogenase
MSAVLRWGIVGPGRIAEQFAADIRLVPQASLAAVASRSLRSASEFAARHGGIRAHGSYDDLFRDGDVDAVYIATPHTLHAAQSRAALAAGKAVLCEKPITISPEELRSLRDYARARNVYLTEGMWTWYLPAIRRAQDWVDAGRIGPVRHVKADFGYPLPYDPARREYDHSLAGGCLLEMGIYPLAIADLFMRQVPAKMEVVRHLAPNGVEDDVTMLFDYGEGRSASLATSFRCKLNNWLYVVGEEGYIAVPDFWRAASCRLFRLDEEIDRFDDGRRGFGFEFEIEAVTNDILSGRRESPVVRSDDSLRFQSDLATLRARCRG